MISFWRIFWLEILSLTRSYTLLLLTAVSMGWMLLVPSLVRSDGTAEGAWRLDVQYSLGGVFTLLVISLLASATGSVARERVAKRLQLTLVRPVRFIFISLGKILAHVTVGAIVLALACVILLCRAESGRRCNHVLSPVLPSPRAEAQAMYESYMGDPSTPEAVRNAKKEVVIRLLTQRAVDRYETIATNSTMTWRFEGLGGLGGLGGLEGLEGLEGSEGLAVRMRFTNQMELRQDVRGVFRMGGMSAVVSNITQAILKVPLTGSPVGISKTAELVFDNLGSSALMLRPRKDLQVLVPADTFAWNLLRAFLGMLAVLSLVVSVGVFLSCALGRPVALFVAFSVLAVGEMSPSVAEQYPDSLETNLADRIGLVITRCATEVMRPISSFQPLTALSADECVESRMLVTAVFVDLVVFPLLFSFLAAFVMPRKQDDLV